MLIVIYIVLSAIVIGSIIFAYLFREIGKLDKEIEKAKEEIEKGEK